MIPSDSADNFPQEQTVPESNLHCPDGSLLQKFVRFHCPLPSRIASLGIYRAVTQDWLQACAAGCSAGRMFMFLTPASGT
jgi:hypothetical protein